MPTKTIKTGQELFEAGQVGPDYSLFTADNEATTIESEQELVDLKSLELLVEQESSLNPNSIIGIGDKVFGISAPVKNSGQERALLYVLEGEDANEKLNVRLLYRSNSGGDWRVALGVNRDEIYIKGGGRHYTQETKLHPSILSELNSQSAATEIEDQVNDALTEIFKVPLEQSRQEFINEVEEHHALEGVTSLRAGYLGKEDGLDSTKLRRQTEQINEVLLQDFENEHPQFTPDLSVEGIISVSRKQHSLLGECMFTKFKATINGREAYWEFGESRDGETVWVDKIGYSDTPVSSYGTDSEIIDSGVITSKPIEYISQCDAIPTSLRNDINDKGGDYQNIGKFLELLEPIRRYKELRKASRSTN